MNILIQNLFLIVVISILIAVSSADFDATNYLRKLSVETTSYRNDSDFLRKFTLSRKLALEDNSKTGHHSHHIDSAHHRPWEALREVDGLKNTEVIVFVTSTTAHQETYLWERIIPSARTWMKMFANVYTIVEDNFAIRYALRQCHHRDFKDYTIFECHNEPNYLLTRKCSDEYYGHKGPCCKVDDMINYLVNENAELFKNIKFLLHADDDTYFRADQVLRWLAAVEKSGYNDYPLAANAGPSRTDNPRGVWHINNCHEIQSSGWYQPLMFNRAALERLKVPSAAYGLTDTCRHFVVTHDVGVEPFVWLMEFYHIHMPRVEINGGHKGSEVFQPDLMVVHALKHDDSDNCRPGQEHTWPENLRYNQRIVSGCGDIGHHSPTHNPKKIADMYDAFEYYSEHGKDIQLGVPGQNDWIKANVTFYPEVSPVTGQRKIKEVLPKDATVSADGMYNGLKVEEKVIPVVVFIEGYRRTKHGQENDLTKVWKEFTLKDCSPAGSIQ